MFYFYFLAFHSKRVFRISRFVGEFNCMITVSHCELNGLLYSGGVQLTVNGSNLNLVERPKMNVSVIISDDGEVNHTYTIMVRSCVYIAFSFFLFFFLRVCLLRVFNKKTVYIAEVNDSISQQLRQLYNVVRRTAA